MLNLDVPRCVSVAIVQGGDGTDVLYDAASKKLSVPAGTGLFNFLVQAPQRAPETLRAHVDKHMSTDPAPNLRVRYRAHGPHELDLPADACSICYMCGHLMPRGHVEAHVSTCASVAWHDGIVNSFRRRGTVAGTNCVDVSAGLLGNMTEWSFAMSPGPASGASFIDAGERLRAARLLNDPERRKVYHQLVSLGWHDDEHDPLSPDEVLVLTGSEAADFASMEMFFVGEGNAADAGSPYTSHVLYEPSLAPELRPAAKRVSKAVAEQNWIFYVTHFDGVKLGGSTDAGEMAKNSTVSYGRHGATVRRTSSTEGGYKSYGQYENAHHETARSGVPLDVLENDGFLLKLAIACLSSLSVIPRALVFRPRLQNLRLCSTRRHNDRERGDTLSFARYILEPGKVAALLFDLKVAFNISLCSYKGRLLLPLTSYPPYRPTELGRGRRVLKAYAWTSAGVAVQVELPESVTDSIHWVEIGLLEVVVHGMAYGTVRCFDRLDLSSWESISSTAPRFKSTAPTILTPAAALQQALRNPRRKPPARYVCIGWDGKWFGFSGWGLTHVLLGDGSLRRVHVFSRLVSENPNCATVNRETVTVDPRDADESETVLARLHGMRFAAEWN